MSKDIEIMAIPIVAIPDMYLDNEYMAVGHEVDLAELLDGAEYLVRKHLETDFAYKQVIPYVVVEDITSGQVLTYTRSTSSGEDRLHNRVSVGIGGHIDVVLEETLTTDPLDIFIDSMIREVQEELGFNTVAENYQIVGIVNDDSDEVGKVHLGVVYSLKINGKKLKLDQGEVDVVINRSWQSVDEVLDSENAETWTKFALSLIKERDEIGSN